MARVEIASLSLGELVDTAGNAQSGKTMGITYAATGAAATVYAAASGTATTLPVTNSNGYVQGYLEEGAYTFTNSGSSHTVDVVSAQTQGAINVKAYGAVGDGAANDTAAVVAARDAVMATRVTNPDHGGKTIRAVLYFPPGRYKVSAKALMDDLGGAGPVRGARIAGGGRENTVIELTDAGPLLYNNDQFLQTSISDITFIASSSSAIFIDSVSQGGGAQNMTYDRVNWGGTWGTALKLRGNASADNNSEWSFYHCGVGGTYTTFMHVGAGGNQAEDLFLNYNFFACQMEPTQGDIIRLDYGGSVNVWGGSWIISGAAGGRMLYAPNPTHSSGTTRVKFDGVRYEVRNSNTKIADVAWKTGNITFQSCSLGGQIGSIGSSQVVATFYGSADEGVNVVFDNCDMCGKVEYKYDGNTFNADSRATYRNCKFLQAVEAVDAVLYTAVAGTTNTGGKWQIVFEQCSGAATYGNDGAQHPFDCTLGFNAKRNALARKRAVAFTGFDGGIPWGGEPSIELWLPLGAIITNIQFNCPANGGSAGTTWTYAVKTNEGAPTTLAAFAPGTAWNLGWNQANPQWYVCSLDTKRHLTLSQTNAASTGFGSMCVVEYIA